MFQEGKDVKIRASIKSKRNLPGNQTPITKGQLENDEQIDRLVEQFTQTYNYPAYVEIDRQSTCHQLDDSIRMQYRETLDEIRRTHRLYMQQARVQRNRLVTELIEFKTMIIKLVLEYIPRVIRIRNEIGSQQNRTNSS